LSEQVDLEQVVEKCPMNMTGADFYALCADALMNALLRIAQNRPKDFEVQEQEDTEIIVEQDDFLIALSRLKPSIPMHELQRYDELQQTFKKKPNTL
jgi:peroxin-6